MRVLLIIIAVVLVLSVAGWISFHHEPGRASVTIETSKIQSDTAEAVHTGANALRKAGDKVDEQAAPAAAPSQPTQPVTPQPVGTTN